MPVGFVIEGIKQLVTKCLALKQMLINIGYNEEKEDEDFGALALSHRPLYEIDPSQPYAHLDLLSFGFWQSGDQTRLIQALARVLKLPTKTVTKFTFEEWSARSSTHKFSVYFEGHLPSRIWALPSLNSLHIANFKPDNIISLNKWFIINPKQIREFKILNRIGDNEAVCALPQTYHLIQKNILTTFD
ncbi:hypothetical protein ABW20_dc0104132 [Dactylellina cionopaga]|nr:hypothetical protein ABW20_dc0104132 [Dactylellina cionopaga]